MIDITPQFTIIPAKEKLQVPPSFNDNMGEPVGNLKTSPTATSVGEGNNVFKITKDGIHLGNTDFASAPFSVTMLGAINATDLTVTGGSISIGSGSPAPFIVDSSGNAKVKSLQRKDYHWFTLFESLDGYATVLDGTGSLSIGSVGATSVTGTISGNNNELQKLNYTPTSNAITWGKDKSVKYSIGFQNPVSDTVVKLGIGSLQALTNKHIGFKFTNGVVYGTVANGTTETELNLNYTLTNNTFYLLEFYLTAGSGVEFFINNVSKGTITTNLPTGSSLNEWILDWHLQTTIDASREMWLSFIDLWQAN